MGKVSIMTAITKARSEGSGRPVRADAKGSLIRSRRRLPPRCVKTKRVPGRFEDCDPQLPRAPSDAAFGPFEAKGDAMQIETSRRKLAQFGFVLSRPCGGRALKQKEFSLKTPDHSPSHGANQALLLNLIGPCVGCQPSHWYAAGRPEPISIF